MREKNKGREREREETGREREKREWNRRVVIHLPSHRPRVLPLAPDRPCKGRKMPSGSACPDWPIPATCGMKIQRG